MNKKIKKYIKISIILFILLLISFNKVYALEEMMIEKNYEKIETEDGEFYKRKNTNQIYNTHVSVNSSGINAKIYDEYLKLSEIIKEKVNELIKDFTSKGYPKEQKIKDDYYININKIYSISEENPYKDGDDIVAVIQIYAHPVDGTNNYWKENFSNNELYYDKYQEEYSVYIYYFVRLSMNSETREYEIAYMDLKPENLEQYLSDLKEKGIDLENLDVEKILNTSYEDEFKVVPSSNTVATGGNKTEYNTANVEDISNMAFLIRLICIVFLMLIITIGIRKKYKN